MVYLHTGYYSVNLSREQKKMVKAAVSKMNYIMKDQPRKVCTNNACDLFPKIN